MAATNIALEIFAGSITLLLLLCCLLDKSGRDKSARLFVSMLAVNIAVLGCDLFTWVFHDRGDLVATLHIVNSLVYALGYVLTALFTFYLTNYVPCGKRTSRIINLSITAACVIAVILVIVSYGNGMYFYYIDGTYVRGRLYWLSQAYPIAILLLDMGFILHYAKRIGTRDTLSLLSYGILPAIAMVIQIYVFGVTLLYIATTLSLVIIYIAVYLEQSRRLQKRELELQQANVAIMLSQIQPHFLFNALNTIDALCAIDTKAAQLAVRSFAKYLRGNLDALSRKTPVLFRTELEHLQQYMTLETYRFDNIQIEYDLEAMDFMLPTLTLQPIVENAVKYGLVKKAGGGTVRVTTRERRDFIQITVEDDGVGFDVTQKPDGSRSHIGIENVRGRVEAICGGTLTVESMVGVGTIVTILLPKGGERK